MSAQNKTTLTQLLQRLRDFILKLDLNGSPDEGSNFSASRYLVSTAEHGGLSLSGTEADQHADIVDSFSRFFSDSMSNRSLAKLIDVAILKSIDVRKRNQADSFNVRANKAIDEVRSTLSQPHLKWITCIPILGLTPPKRAWIFNNVVFTDINGALGRAFLKSANRVAEQTLDPDHIKSDLKQQIKHLLLDDHEGQAFALITTNALDAEAARLTAKRLVQLLLDSINFAVDFLYGQFKAYGLSLDEPRRRHFESAITINPTDSKSGQQFSGRSFMGTPLNCEDFRRQIARTSFLRRLCQYLRVERPNAHQSRVISAIRWAGRAGTSPRAEEAFLFRAISLESLILGDSTAELSTRLALSVIHLLGKSIRDRQLAFKDLKGLYGLRSKIVHSGNFEVANEEAERMKGIVVRTFAEMLTRKEFLKMTARDELDRWFHKRLLGYS